MKKKCFYQLLSLSMMIGFSFCSENSYSQNTWLKRGSDSAKYEMAIVRDTLHDGKIIMTLKSVEENIEGFGNILQKMLPSKYLGKRIRMSGYMKSSNVADWAGFWLRVDQAEPFKMLSFDNMYDRAINGNTEWKKYEIVLDVPESATSIFYGVLLKGTGQIWFDEIMFETVPNSVATTGTYTGN